MTDEYNLLLRGLARQHNSCLDVEYFALGLRFALRKESNGQLFAQIQRTQSALHAASLKSRHMHLTEAAHAVCGIMRARYRTSPLFLTSATISILVEVPS